MARWPGKLTLSGPLAPGAHSERSAGLEGPVRAAGLTLSGLPALRAHPEQPTGPQAHPKQPAGPGSSPLAARLARKRARPREAPP
ncbi:hypothetical protein Ahu01nite_042820 [Winogradskya humida]|uniref:Uncharacterized protein n=1 Tax=Winogradskya humida TaxID=113566 RepID=A0ABQ3ZRH5_9ACTN|nr:hypothetical protein Ahu01nite_042820 [Actinoplanes humidus]